MRAHAPVVDVSQHDNEGRDHQRDDGKLDVDAPDHHRHRGEHQAGGHHRNQAVHDHPLDRGGVVLDAVSGVDRALGVVVREGKTLHMEEELTSKLEDEPFAGVGLQQPAPQPTEVHEQANGHQQQGGGDEHGAPGPRGGGR